LYANPPCYRDAMCYHVVVAVVAVLTGSVRQSCYEFPCGDSHVLQQQLRLLLRLLLSHCEGELGTRERCMLHGCSFVSTRSCSPS